MFGITSIGAYIPFCRLSRDKIAAAWETRSLRGERAVANFDEDSLTMAVAAARNCMKRNEKKIDSLSFATTTSPFKEKQAASTIAAALDLFRECRTNDLTNSLRAATSAIHSSIDSVKSGSAENALVLAADCRMGAAKGEYEQRFGDGAAAVMIGKSDVIATIEDSASIFNEFIDQWRLDNDTFIRSWEERFTTSEGYKRTVVELVSKIMERNKLNPKDFARAVFSGPNERITASVAKRLGFDPKSQLIDSLFSTVGDTGTAAPLLMLTSALEASKPGDKILLSSYGDGGDVLILNVTKDIEKIQDNRGVKNLLDKKMPISYEKYLTWRDLIPIEPARWPRPLSPSVTCMWRETKKNLALYGGKCRQCGTVQLPAQRVCISCQAKDDFDDCKLSDKIGHVYTYTMDYLDLTKDPPSVTAVVDFDGGGRLLCRITDRNIKEIKTGMPVEMTFRKIKEVDGINSYFWKGKPATQ